MKNQPECTIVHEEDYHNACEQYTGWCKVCREFTTDQRICDFCQNREVIGAENALIVGLIGFE
jgi:wobble nucleotide-excising tRNase